MPAVNPGEVWMVDFGLAAKVRPALLLTGNPVLEELNRKRGFAKQHRLGILPP